jgi:hypothetical protein
MSTTCGESEACEELSSGIAHSVAGLRHTPTMETTILALASLALAIVLAAVGIAGLAERLPHGRRAATSVTPARPHEDGRRRARWHAASATSIGAAGPPLLLGVALLVRPPEELADWFLVYALAGVVTGGLIALGRRRAELAAAGLEDTWSAHDEERP